MGLSYNMWEVDSAPEWLLDKLNKETSNNMIKIAMVLWGVRWARNKHVWEMKMISTEVAMSQSSKHISEWREAHKRKSHTPSQSHTVFAQHVNIWMAPDIGMLKINVDASVLRV